ncbi:MAG: hypothetical protein GY869_03790, partial [Planctomycetes bacterium]|nr:hypothetical protein [Planctomycetota bacterium]
YPANSEWNTDEQNEGEWGENGYTRTWLGAPYLWWVADLRDENYDGCYMGDCTDYPIPRTGTFLLPNPDHGTVTVPGTYPNDIYRYRTDVGSGFVADVDYGGGPTNYSAIAENNMVGDILGFYDYQYDSDEPRWAIWRPNNPYESPVRDADRDGMVDALDPNTFYNDNDQDGLPDLFEDPDMDGINVVCDANNTQAALNGIHCIDADFFWMPGENWVETSKWDGDTDDDGLWDGDEIFPSRIALDDIPNYNLYHSDPLDRDTDNDGVVDGYNNGGTDVFYVVGNEYQTNYGEYNPWDPRTFNDGAWPGNENVKDWVCRWHFNTGRNTPGASYEDEFDPDNYLTDEASILRANFHNRYPDIPGELVATIDYIWGPCELPVWSAGQVPFIPGDYFFKAYHTATDPNNPDTDGDRYADGWMPTYNAGGFLLNHYSNEPRYYAPTQYMEGMPHYVYPADFLVYDDGDGDGVPDQPPADQLPMTWNSGNKFDMGSFWLTTGDNHTVQAAFSGYSSPPSHASISASFDFQDTYFALRHYQPPVNWGFFRVTYYKLAEGNQEWFTDRYFEYMLYDKHGLSRHVIPWNDEFITVDGGEYDFDNGIVYVDNRPTTFATGNDGVFDNAAGQMLEGWGRPWVDGLNDHEGTIYQNGNYDDFTDHQINALDRDSDDDECYDWAERRGQKFQDESGDFLNSPIHPSNAGTNHSENNNNLYDPDAAPDLEDYLSNNCHPMRGWDDATSQPLYDDQDGDMIYNSLEHVAGTVYWEHDTDGDGLDDFEEMNDFIYRAPGDPTQPGGPLGGQRTGTGSNPIDPDSDDDMVNDFDEWAFGADAFAYGLALGPHVHPYLGYIITFFRSNPLVVDTDLDGLDDYEEIVDWGTEPRNPDTDCDAVVDGLDIPGSPHPYATLPGAYCMDPAGFIDFDGDFLSDWQERQWYTDPVNPDTDFDGLADGFELNTNRTPLNFHGGNQFNDLFSTDIGGFFTNYALPGHRTEPTLWDTDGDGIPDGWTNLDWLGYEMGYWTGEDRDRDGNIAGDDLQGVDGYRIHEAGEDWTETDPLNRDSDGQYSSHNGNYTIDLYGFKDGLVDGYEENTNLRGLGAYAGVADHPFDFNYPESNPLSLDSDGDYLVDNLER